MDKLRRVLNGNDSTPEEESSIITQVTYHIACKFKVLVYVFKFSLLNCNNKIAGHHIIASW